MQFRLFAGTLTIWLCGLMQISTSEAASLNRTKGSSSSNGGFIVVAGGYTNFMHTTTASCYAYDIDAGIWTSLPDLPAGREGGALVTHKSMVFYASGYSPSGSTYFNNVLQLSMSEQAWIEGPPLQYIHNSGVNAVSINQSMYVLGGSSSYVEQFSGCNGNIIWTKMASSLRTHGFSGAAALNGFIYVCGEEDNLSTFCERYDPVKDQWNSITPLNQPRHELELVALNGYLYAIGGSENANNERFNPNSNQWTYFSAIPGALHGAAATDGKNIYVVGSQMPTDVVSMYSPSLDLWRNVDPYPVAISQTSATFVKSLP